MHQTTRLIRLAASSVAVLLLAPDGPVGLNVAQPTFVEDVAPILHANCVSCHQPDEIGPMSLRTYREVRPWARSIARAVENRDMPPWDADPGYGPWLNDISLNDDEIAAITRWAANGAPRGEGDEPVYEQPEAAGEWTFGEPDWVFEFDPWEVAPEGPDEFRDVLITTGFEEDRWIRAIEVQPGDRKVLHHFILWRAAEGASYQESWMAAWTAGAKPYRFPAGSARLLQKGRKMIGDFHYHPRGEAATDTTRIGLWFAEPEEVEKELVTLPVWNAGINIPAGDPNYEAEASRVLEEDVLLHAFTPHMHYRGKSMFFSAELPDGSTRDLLRVSRYDFNWQTTYQLSEPIRLPAGTRVRVKASFDNSADNPENPDPTVDVTWGLESSDEMLNGLVDYVAADSDDSGQAADSTGASGR
ncbi:MAG: cytochrome c [Acidobacteria bacterium]|nr:cytochrome c [Acidobacteriota bacterium]